MVLENRCRPGCNAYMYVLIKVRVWDSNLFPTLETVNKKSHLAECLLLNSHSHSHPPLFGIEKCGLSYEG